MDDEDDAPSLGFEVERDGEEEEVDASVNQNIVGEFAFRFLNDQQKRQHIFRPDSEDPNPAPSLIPAQPMSHQIDAIALLAIRSFTP
jgi:hypothetical protein